jgi:hypothetical protein
LGIIDNQITLCFIEGILGIIGNQITLCFGKGYRQRGVFFKEIFGIIGNQITLCFWKGLAIEVGGLSDATVFTTLPVALSHVNMDDYDLRVTRQYGFALITYHYVSLLFIKRHQASMHAAAKEKCILPLITFILSVDHIAPIRQSQSMHASCFLLRMGLCQLCFLRAPDV